MPRGIYDRNRSTRRSTIATPRTVAHDTAPASPTPQGDDAPAKMSTKLTRAVDTLRGLFIGFVQEFTALTMSREELAPRFYKTFLAWKEETGGSFVDFVRVLVPEVPMDRAGYKAHSAYNAADNLRRLAQAGTREEETPVARAKRIAAAPVNPRRALARVLASLAPILDPTAMDAVWKAASAQLHWTDGQIEAMKALVGEESPLVKVRAPRGVTLDHSLKLVVAPAPASPSEDLAATA